MNTNIVPAKLAALFPSSAVVAAPAPKVGGCHNDADQGASLKINIRDNAFPADAEHGDAAPGEPVPGWEVWALVTDCQPVPEGMAALAAGGFPKGCDPAEPRLHPAYLDDNHVERTKVTNRPPPCATAGGCTAPGNFPSSNDDAYCNNPGYANHPVIDVHCSQAADCCAWAGLRLPTEADWQKAARGTTQGSCPLGRGAAAVASRGLPVGRAAVPLRTLAGQPGPGFDAACGDLIILRS